MSFFRGCLILALLVLVFGPAYADPLGRIGPTYEIKEEDMIEYMKRRLQEAKNSGELERRRQQKLGEVKQLYQNPPPVSGLQEAKASRTYYFDPGVVAEENILDDKGNVVVASGTYVNPLDMITMSKAYLFFDARSKRQTEMAAKIVDKYQRAVFVVLVGGSPTELRKAWGMKIFFDQRGYLTRRLGIQQVPALVTQAGKQLRVDEIRVE